jgi:ComF family protein
VPPASNSRTSLSPVRGSSLEARAKASTNFLIASLFAPPCAACKRPLASPLDGAVCADCWSLMRVMPHLQHCSSGQLVDWWCAVGDYDGRLKETIHALKYERRRSIGPRLGELMRECAAPMLAHADAVVPVPLHPRREYQRGFNQAEDLGLHLGLPLLPLLRRTRHTQSQIELPKNQRQHNVKNAFELNAEARGRMPEACVVVLVDDVSTTGSTIDACARVLKEAGVKEVRAVTAARVVSERR